MFRRCRVRADVARLDKVNERALAHVPAIQRVVADANTVARIYLNA